MRLAVAAALALAAIPVPAAAAPARAPVSGFVNGAGGVRLHYLDFGGKGTPVVLLAGAANSAWIYGDFGRSLARRHRVLALTRRGHGDSAYPGKGYDIDTLAEDVRRFLNRRGIKRAALVGHSLAGAEMTRFAVKYPERVSALVYLDAAYDRAAQLKMPDADPVPPESPTAADRVSKAAFIAAVRRTRPDLARYWSAPVVRDLEAMVGKDDKGYGWRTSGAIFGEWFASAAAAPPDYSGISVPALAIYSVEDEDFRLPANFSPALKAKLDAFEAGPLAGWRNASIAQFRRAPRATVVEMDAGHHLFLHRPAETQKLVGDFLARYAR